MVEVESIKSRQWRHTCEEMRVVWMACLSEKMSALIMNMDKSMSLLSAGVWTEDMVAIVDEALG